MTALAKLSWRNVEIPHQNNERRAVRVQKGLLGGARISAMKRGPTGHASHHEHLRHLALAGQINGRLIPVHLAFHSPVIALRDKDFGTE